MRRKIEKVLSLASPDLQTLKDNHFIIGSCALILSGVSIENTSDLDLLVSHQDAEQLKLIWSDRLRKNYTPSDVHLFQSNFGRFYFGELDIEIMGGLTVFNANKWRILQVREWIEVSVGEYKIKIPTLNEQSRFSEEKKTN